MTFEENAKRYSNVVSKMQNVTQGKYNDVVKAICTADNLWGINPQKLSYKKWKEFGSNHDALPEVQVMRVWCDVLTLLNLDSLQDEDIVFANGSSSIVYEALTGKKKALDAKQLSYEECEKILEKFSLLGVDNTELYKKLLEVYHHYKPKFNKYFSISCHGQNEAKRNSLVLPLSLKSEFSGELIQTFTFLNDFDFVKFLTKYGYSTQDYLQYFLTYLVYSSCQNIILAMEKLDKVNNPLLCTFGIRCMRDINNSVFHALYYGNFNLYINRLSNTRVCNQYIERLFQDGNVIISSDYRIAQEDLLLEITSKLQEKGVAKWL